VAWIGNFVEYACFWIRAKRINFCIYYMLTEIANDADWDGQSSFSLLHVLLCYDGFVITVKCETLPQYF
jgi:hypothetical protein